ncbi:MAG: VOC family protein [Thermoplasmata archaeon]
MEFVFTYTGIRVQDLDRSIRFYTDVLGMKLLGRSEIPYTRGETAGLQGKDSGHVLELNWYSEDSPVAGPFKKGEELDHLAFQVDDLDKALEYLRMKGHPIVSEKREEKGASWAYVEDPDGNWIELFELSK